jgi:hypothetical protein
LRRFLTSVNEFLEHGMMKASVRILTVAALACLGVLTGQSTCRAAATANLVVVSTNPNGAPADGNQYLLGIQVAGISAPTFLGSNLVNFTGSLKNTTTTASGSFYSAPKVLFQSESDTAASGDASYARKNDSYFASPWQTLLASPNGAGETATSLFIDGGSYGALPSKVPSNGIYPFAYIDVTSSTGVSIQGEFAIGTDRAPIGNGNGLQLTLDGQLIGGVLGDFNANGIVDSADYVLWRNGGALQNDPTAGVQAADYDFWRSRFGAAAGVSAAVETAPAAIPEPSSIGLLAIAIWWRCQCGGWQGAWGNS